MRTLRLVRHLAAAGWRIGVVTLTVDTMRPGATLDPALVRHVLTNFIANAVDAMERGGRLSVQARRLGDQLAF